MGKVIRGEFALLGLLGGVHRNVVFSLSNDHEHRLP
jgi:hypothetical protein